MSLENYEEMRAAVMDPHFKRHQELALELEGRFPDRFIRRYSMVMFHPEIPYAEALRRGAVQAEIIAAIDREPERAAALIHERLPPIGRRAGP
jgi:kynurenine 3-monooxygenase